MSRTIRPHAAARRSLAGIGVPDHRDALAVYLLWRREAYYRRNASARARSPSTTCATGPAAVSREPSSPLLVARLPSVPLAVSLLCVGAGIDADALCEPAEYPREIDC
ncbi:hypothetical protein ACN47E_009420 [Coniothyrium glycines]